MKHKSGEKFRNIKFNSGGYRKEVMCYEKI